MAYAAPGDRRSGTTRRHTGRAGESRTGTVTSSGRRQVTARGGSSGQYRSGHNYQTGRRKDSSLSLRQGNLRFNHRRGGLVGQVLDDPRLFVMLIVALLLVLAALFGISSCVRSRAEANKVPEASEADARVSAGLSATMTERLTAALDANEQLATIASNANKLDDERLIDLALTEPTAIEYVAGFLANDAPKSAKTYDGRVSRGSYPTLYDWDTRWGYASYGTSVVGLNGSGLTSLAMAYYGLTGKAELTPATLATRSTETETLSETYGTSADFFETYAGELGLEVEKVTPSGEALNDVLDSGTVVLLQLREGTVTDHAHWALAVSENLDGSIILRDPTSSSVTAHPWDPDTLAGASEAFFAISALETEE